MSKETPWDTPVAVDYYVDYCLHKVWSCKSFVKFR